MLPELTNVYGIIYSNLTKEEIAKKFEMLGWEIQKASWFDWMITNEFTELIIDGDKEILIHGPVAPNYFNTLTQKMKELGLRFSLELYNEDKVLITEVKTNL
jgi:hypothetical protein